MAMQCALVHRYADLHTAIWWFKWHCRLLKHYPPLSAAVAAAAAAIMHVLIHHCINDTAAGSCGCYPTSISTTLSAPKKKKKK